jgi:hypothetical protein
LVVGQFVDASIDWPLLVIELTAHAIEVDHLAEVKVVKGIWINFDDPTLCVLHFLFQYLMSLLKSTLNVCRNLYLLLRS